MKLSKEIRLKNLIMYGVGDLYGGGSFFIIQTLFIYFLTDVVGLPPMLAGTVFLLGKFWDAISDPLMGYISDNTNSRFGRRRLFFLIGLLPVGLSFVMLWVPVNFASTAFTFLYYTFAYIFFCTVFTMVMIPYSALNADMTLDYKERTRLSGARMIFSQFSALLAGVLPKLIIDYYDGSAVGYFTMGLGFGILYMLPWLFVYFGTWELQTLREEDNPEVSFIANFLTIFRNRSFRYHIGMYLAAYSAIDILMALFIFVITYFVQRPSIYSLCLGAMVLTQIAFLPVYVKVSNRLGSGPAYRIGLSIWGIAMLLMFGLSSASPTWFIIMICIVIGAGLSAGAMIPWAILPSVIDVDELITAKRRAGVYSGMMTLIRKTVQALVSFLVSVALSAIGYVANTEQTVATLTSLKLIFILAPLTLIVVGIALAGRFKITPQTHAVMIGELERLRDGGKRTGVRPEVKRVCEEVTGIRYELLYQK